MGQNEVYELLKNERLKGNNEYLSIAQVYKALLDMKEADAPARANVYASIKKLQRSGYLEVKGIGQWPAYFRLKENYVFQGKIIRDYVNPGLEKE